MRYSFNNLNLKNLKLKMNQNIQNNINVSFAQTKEFKLIYNLLDKAEQILSIINLSESSISKYNTLKKLTFEMLNIEFKPLEKKIIPSSNQSQIETEQNSKISNEVFNLLFFQNVKRGLLIELMIDYINNNDNLYEEKNLNYYFSTLTDIFNLNIENVCNKPIVDMVNDINNEEKKMADIFTKIDQTFSQNFEILQKIRKNYENELYQLKENFNNEISELKFKIDNNTDLKRNDFYINKIIYLIDESFEKYHHNNPEINDSKSIAFKDGDKDEDIMKLEFLQKVLDSFFNTKTNIDINKYKTNKVFNDNEQLSNEIFCLLPDIKKDNESFHKNFNELMNYIADNIENKI